jgi:hypothetical protein
VLGSEARPTAASKFECGEAGEAGAVAPSVKEKLVPAEVLINGKLVRLEQLSFQACAKVSTSSSIDQWEAGEAGAAAKLAKS